MPDDSDLDEIKDLDISSDNTSEGKLQSAVVKVRKSISIDTSFKPTTSRTRRRTSLWKHISGVDTARCI